MGCSIRGRGVRVVNEPLVRRATLHGWGRTSPSDSDVYEPDQAEQVPKILATGVANDGSRTRGSIARGMGRSYGDAAQNAGGAVVSSAALSRILELDTDNATVRVEAGVTIETLLKFLVPRGFFPTVIPGTGVVSVGGAIAADIHGKFRHGSFCDFVDSAVLVTPARGPIEIAAHINPDVFWATAGGMGLTGVVTEATLRLHRITTSQMRVDTRRCRDVDECMNAMLDDSRGERYSVAWIDCLASGANLGRSVLEVADHASVDELPAKRASDPLGYGAGVSIAAPGWMPNGLLNPVTVKAFNELWFRKSPRHPHSATVSIPGFFHPLDMVKGWPAIYGRHGFVQYQFVVPYGCEKVVRIILERLAAAKCASFLAVLKRFETENLGLLSFPMPGWTLALDIPAQHPGLSKILDDFDDLVLEAEGRVYLAKDARVAPHRFAAMYPQLDQWRNIRTQLDPHAALQSDLSRRLGL